MAENELLLSPDLESIEHGNSTATAEGIQALHLRLAAVENELRLAKAKGLAANIPPDNLKCVASTTATVGTYDIYHPRTGKVSTRLGPLGQIQSDRGSYVDSEGGIIMGGESSYGASLFDNYYGQWYTVPGHETYGASNDSASFNILHKFGGVEGGGTNVDHVLQIRHAASLAPFEEYALCPPRSPSGFGAARPSVSVGSTAHADYAFERGVFKDLFLTTGGVTDLNAGTLGNYVTFAYSAGNFFGGGGMTWGVDDADEVIRYMQFGKMMHVNGYIQSTDCSGGQPTLFMTLPASKTLANFAIGSMFYADVAGGAVGPGFCYGNATANNIVFQKGNLANWTATTGDDLSIYFSIWLEFA